jgi:hypothetical protein
VPTDLDLNRNELIRTQLRGDYMGMKCLGLPRTVLEADFLVSTHPWSDVTLSMKNMFGVVPKYNIRPPKTRLGKTPILGGSVPDGSGVSISSFERGVAVTVAVHCSTSTTFQAFAGDPLCAQDFCKLLVKCEFPKDGCDEHG